MPEMTILTLAALLQVSQVALYSVAANRQIDKRVALGPRDSPIELEGVAGRLKRAMNNHFEGLLLFSIACSIITLTDQSTVFTAICGWIYLAARIAYVPAYAFGLSPWRSVVWCIGLAATTAMLIAAII
ncbi:MAG: MAPEG family protein [Roseobacter sp.]